MTRFTSVLYAGGVFLDRIRTLFNEPRVANPPHRTRFDYIVVAAMVVGITVEVALRTDLVWKWASLAVVIVLIGPVLYRRTHPLLALVATFACTMSVETVAIIVDANWEGPYSLFPVLLMPYALFRWGSGREAFTGLAVLAGPILLNVISPARGLSDIIGSAVIFFLVCEIGAVVRYQQANRLQAVEQVKITEREQLARELHDTVAHHVSAIAVQAQAGQMLAASSPERAVQALATIEEEASRALAEMRAMVGVLRSGEEPQLAPQPGIDDIAGLAVGLPPVPRVEVAVQGDVAGLHTAVDAALFRIAQESITNAFRHATGATRVAVAVSGDPHSVRLTVKDDGRHRAAPPSGSGYGLIGMSERVKLLGGSLRAGPGDTDGWTVEAVLPRIAADT